MENKNQVLRRHNSTINEESHDLVRNFCLKMTESEFERGGIDGVNLENPEDIATKNDKN